MILRFVCLWLLIAPSMASAQSFQLQGSAGPTMIDTGHSVSAGAGVTLSPRVSILVNWERSHMPSEVLRDELGRVTGASRRGTLTVGAAELRVALFSHDRIGPYALAGFAAGISRPNVNEIFPHAVTNDMRAVFFGGGVQLPVGGHMSVFADARLLFGVEEHDGIVGALPVRAGLAWRF
jgi:hypothetical protein